LAIFVHVSKLDLSIRRLVDHLVERIGKTAKGIPVRVDYFLLKIPIANPAGLSGHFADRTTDEAGQ
jgi:hypothetical protein